MEPINPLQTLESQQTAAAVDPNQPSWKRFTAKFSKTEEEVFMKNMTQHFSQMIAKHLRKMKESLRKMREESQKKF